jgi:hypothetical protein
VALGTFNIYIIQPAWLKAVGLIDDSIEQIVLESDFRRPGFRMQLPTLTWYVEPTRIMLETSHPQTDCGVAMSTIINKLPFTPLHAVGVNASYEALLQDVDLSMWRHPASDRSLGSELALQHSGWGASFRKGRQTYNVQLVVNAEQNVATASTNVELRLSDADDSGVAKEMTDNCQNVQRESAEILQKTFELRIHHADNHAPA